MLACLLCAVLTAVGLVFPPAMYVDSGGGMMEWRTLIGGGPANSITGPDARDISRDLAAPVSTWSPGQYLIPGLFTLTGMRMGTALTITAGVSLLLCLFGWVRVARRFRLSPGAALLLVACIGTFRYSTLPFGIYNGGEILLQGATPWLILAGCAAPLSGVAAACCLAFAMVLVGFLAKLTGVIVAIAAVAGGILIAWLPQRRISRSMAAAGFGAILAVGILYVTWYSRAWNPATPTDRPVYAGDFGFVLAAPWGSGISWMDLLQWLFYNPARPVLHDPYTILWFLSPAVIAFAAILFRGRRLDLVPLTLCVYAVLTGALGAIFLRGGVVSLEERHFRSVGTLIFVCAVAVLDRFPFRHLLRIAVWGCCVLMSLYGCLSLVSRVRSEKPEFIDAWSRTYQVLLNPSALRFLREAWTREGRDSLFILPSPDGSVTLPVEARVHYVVFDYRSDSQLAELHYAGRVPGHLYIVIETRLAQTKGIQFLSNFAGYDPGGWQRREFGETTVLVQ